MSRQDVILIFDVGKTNKKLLLFDEDYNIIHEESTHFEEITDEDGFPCENLTALTFWVKEKFQQFLNEKYYDIKAVNFSAYGASFVYIDKQGNVLTPLYNYLKPFPEKFKQQFYKTYGEEKLIAKQTASPVLDSLNSGMQLYLLKYKKPEVYNSIEFALHLPQYLSFILSKKVATDISSVGCHTMLWNFLKNNYNDWVYKERMNKKFAPLFNGDKIIATIDNNIKVGIGLHDSSAALIPYLASFNEPFVLISTGTWNISLNPFNHAPLTDEELKQDCLCYLSYKGNPVKASRLFAGHEHEEQIKRLAVHFNIEVNCYKTVLYDDTLIEKLQQQNVSKHLDNNPAIVQQYAFSKRELNDFKTYEEAYHQLMLDIMSQQIFSTKLILNNSSTKKIFVDGGFSKNDVFMNLLASSFPNMQVYAASVAQASALGAALVLHSHISRNNIPSNLIRLKLYTSKTD